MYRPNINNNLICINHHSRALGEVVESEEYLTSRGQVESEEYLTSGGQVESEEYLTSRGQVEVVIFQRIKSSSAY